MDLRILGPVEARVDGQALPLPGTRQRALLAVLLLRRGEPVSPATLVEEVWGPEQPREGVKALQVAVSRLRRALGPDGPRLVNSAAGYAFRLEPGELDVERFDQRCEEGRTALAAGQPERAAARLRSALEEWRGPPLADLAYEPFAAVEAARLEERRVAALEDRIDADLALGRHGELTGELEGLVAREPLRERLRAQLMLALYRAGRQGEALAAYRAAVRTLDAELGVRPGPDLDRLQEAILAHDPELAVTHAPAFDAPRVEPRRSTATILVTDVAGLQLGDPAADALRREHEGRLRDVLALHGGRQVKALGDGLMLAFESAGAAVACAVDMQRATDRHRDVALALRVGLAAGDVTWEAGDAFGTPVVGAHRPGNPFFVGEVVRALAEDGDPAATVTPRVRDVVRWRLNRLPSGTAEVLATAAVTGPEFDADVVAGAAGLEIDLTLDALEAAETARLVRPAGALDRFAFTHALVRQTIVGDIAAGRRVRVHARVARALELAAGRRTVPAAELAAHFAAAGGLVDAAGAVRYAAAAGDEAAAALAFDLAAEQYERALAAQSRLPAVADEDRLELEIARGRALRLAGDERAGGVLRKAAASAEAAGDGPRMAEALLAIGLDLATDFMFDDPEMAALLRRALELLPADADAVRARLLGYLAVEVPNIVGEAERRAMVERALVLARGSGDTGYAGRTSTALGEEARVPAASPEATNCV